MTKAYFYVLFMKGCCADSSSVKQCLPWITNTFPSKWHRTASTASSCKYLPSKIFHWNSSGDYADENSSARIEEDNCEAERTSLSSTAKATSSTQRPQTCTEAATKYYNYTLNETDEEREHRLPTLPNASRMDQATLIKFTVKITFFDAAIGSKSCAPQSCFSNGLGTADQPLHHEQQSVLQ